MSRYQCFRCDEIFTEEEADYHTVLETHWWLDGHPIEELTYMACPECGCEDWEEVFDDEEDESEE